MHLSRHTVVCRAAKRNARTHVCYLHEPKFCRFKPSVSQKLSRRFLRNLYILCPTYTPPLIPNLKEIASVVREIFVLKNRPIFFVFFFFFFFFAPKLKSFKVQKIIFSCFDFLQIWYTYTGLKGLQTL